MEEISPLVATIIGRPKRFEVFLTVLSEMKLGVYGLISFLENICECINGFSSLKTIGNDPAIRDSLSFYRIISIL